VVIGLIVSIPIIIWGSKVIGMFIQKWPIIITLGSVFLGWTAGEMVIADRQVLHIVDWYSWLKWVMPSIFAGIVAVFGHSISNKRRESRNKR
jgi:predicted tellurium resistance membrane protein TerC